MINWDEVTFIIDKYFRTVSVPSKGKIAGVQKDRDVNVIIFQVPAEYKGTDLTNFSIRVNYVNANNEVNYATITDVIENGEVIKFAWLLTYDVTQYKGTVKFSVDMFKTAHGGTILQDFHSTIATMEVLDGQDANEHIDPEDTVDILTHLEDELTDHATALETEMTNHKNDLEDELREYADEREATMQDLADQAAASATNARNDASRAQAYAVNASNSATQADTAKRQAQTMAQEAYSERLKAQQAANNAAASAEQAQESVDNMKYFELYVDENGHLIYAYTTNLSGLDFNIKDHKNLEVIIDG